jgi:hypothetical protein
MRRAAPRRARRRARAPETRLPRAAPGPQEAELQRLQGERAGEEAVSCRAAQAGPLALKRGLEAAGAAHAPELKHVKRRHPCRCLRALRQPLLETSPAHPPGLARPAPAPLPPRLPGRPPRAVRGGRPPLPEPAAQQAVRGGQHRGQDAQGAGGRRGRAGPSRAGGAPALPRWSRQCSISQTRLPALTCRHPLPPAPRWRSCRRWCSPRSLSS